MSSLLTNLIAYYKFQGNANDSTTINNGVNTNVTFAQPNGIIELGGNFNGSAYIGVASSTMPAGNTTLTIAAWFKTNTAPASGVRHVCLVGADGIIPAPNNSAFSIFQNTAGVLLVGNYGGNINTGINITDNLWHLVVLTYNSSTSLQTVYIDNISRGTRVQAITKTASQIVIGAGFGPSLVYSGLWVNSIDEVGIWNRELTSSEISQLWNGGNGISYPFTNAGILFNIL